MIMMCKILQFSEGQVHGPLREPRLTGHEAHGQGAVLLTVKRDQQRAAGQVTGNVQVQGGACFRAWQSQAPCNLPLFGLSSNLPVFRIDP